MPPMPHHAATTTAHTTAHATTHTAHTTAHAATHTAAHATTHAAHATKLPCRTLGNNSGRKHNTQWAARCGWLPKLSCGHRLVLRH